MVATLPETKPFINCPVTRLKAPGLSSSIFINSSVASVTIKLTGTYDKPTNASNFSPTLNLDIFCLTWNTG